MAWTDLKAAVAAIVKTNGNQEINGANLQSTLNSIIDQIGANATFKGLAIPSTSPGTPDGVVFYVATTNGVYSNFGALTIQPGEVAILSNITGSWVKSSINKYILNNNRSIAQIYVTEDGYFITEEDTSTNTLYFKVSTGGIAVRASSRADKTLTMATLAKELGVSLVTSPGGLTNCISIADVYSLVLDFDTNTFKIIERTTINLNQIIILSNVYGLVQNVYPTLSAQWINKRINTLESIAADVQSKVNYFGNKNKIQFYVTCDYRFLTEENPTSNILYMTISGGSIAVRAADGGDRTISMTDLATEIGVSLVTSPGGLTNCIEIPDAYNLVYDSADSDFKLVARASTLDSQVILFANVGGLSVEIYETILPQWLKSKYASFEYSSNKNKIQIYPTSAGRIITEENGEDVYFTSSTSLAVRVSGRTDKTLTMSSLVTELGVSLVTSPGGIANCIKIEDSNNLVFDLNSNVFKIVSRTSVAEYMIVLLANVSGGLIEIYETLLPQWLKSTDFISITKDNIDYQIKAETAIVESYLDEELLDTKNKVFDKSSLTSSSFGFITDLHTLEKESISGSKNSLRKPIFNALSCMVDIAKETPLNLIHLNGDYLQPISSPTTNQRSGESACREIHKFVQVPNVMSFMAYGNHELYYAGSDTSLGTLSRDDYFNLILKKNKIEGKIQFDGNNQWGYYDDEQAEIRFVFMSVVETTNIAAQTTWLANTALNNLPAGYEVVIFSHYPLVVEISSAGASNTTYWSTITNFVSGGGNIIACIAGHVHADKSYVKDGILNITTQQAGLWNTNPSDDGNTYSHVSDDPTESTFDIFTVDKTNGKLYATRYGAGQDREFNYNAISGSVGIVWLTVEGTITGGAGATVQFSSGLGTYETTADGSGIYSIPYITPGLTWDIIITKNGEGDITDQKTININTTLNYSF